MPQSESVLAIDIGSGGVTAARVDRRLEVRGIVEAPWTLVPDELSTATLSAWAVLESVEAVVRSCASEDARPEALVLSSMMHTLVVTDAAATPLTPVFTWLDAREFPEAASIRTNLGSGYTARTGAWFHPSFPAYKRARLRSGTPDLFSPGHRLHSLGSWVRHAWTGIGSEDVSTASASGLLNLGSGEWDTPTLEAIGIGDAALLPLVPSGAIETLRADAAARLGLRTGLPVVTGGGDGFLAALGSGCRRGERLAITLGTTAAVRRFEPLPDDVTGAGLFCYRYDRKSFLVGCASNNGGNLLDWARREFGTEKAAGPDPPVFLPFVFGERAPFWDTRRAPRWLGLRESHAREDLGRSAVEAVAFTMANYCRLLAAKAMPEAGVLSGNGFRDGIVGRMLAALVPFPLVTPDDAGTATLRGAAEVAFGALGTDTEDSAEVLVARAAEVEPLGDAGLPTRFDRFVSYVNSDP
jgi:gluconokinase